MRAFTTRAYAFMHGSSWNFTLISQDNNWLQNEFNEDPSFRCRDICKKNTDVCLILIFNEFCIVWNLSIEVPAKIGKIHETPWNFCKHNF